jgi:alkanesulfonate monooxygenase SsuD/methylene tetrahydromethanopterin reductase-like flavin-dependent oxidoreductase (luciferase family)
MRDSIKFGISVDSWTSMLELVQLAERLLGYDLVGIQDHPYQRRLFETWTLITFLCARTELGLGAGGFWDAIAAMGGPRRTPGESVEALEEVIQVIRLMWSTERSVTFAVKHYAVHGLHPGPAPVHPIGIWVGAYRPRMPNLIGRLADGWVPSLGYIDPGEL